MKKFCHELCVLVSNVSTTETSVYDSSNNVLGSWLLFNTLTVEDDEFSLNGDIEVDVVGVDVDDVDVDDVDVDVDDVDVDDVDVDEDTEDDRSVSTLIFGKGSSNFLLGGDLYLKL